jgi:hypothetical protein
VAGSVPNGHLGATNEERFMLGEQIEHARQEPVVVVASQAQAELLIATMRVHEIDAHAVLASAYPSLDWVRGVVITVGEWEAALARELLWDLGHEPVPPPPPG